MCAQSEKKYIIWVLEQHTFHLKSPYQMIPKHRCTSCVADKLLMHEGEMNPNNLYKIDSD